MREEEKKTKSPERVRVEDLVVRFEGDEEPVDVVRGISFTVRAGETFCLVGESGCGKSMTALALLRLIPEPGRIASGKVILEGKDLAHVSEREMCHIRGNRIGMIFQEPMTSLNPVLRVGFQVAEPLMRHRNVSRKEALAAAVVLLRQVGIPAPELRIHEYPHQMSGGMRQRVMIAMALACEPGLLIADEPTTALDVTIQGQILALLQESAKTRGMGMVFITHDLGVVAETADAVGVMYAGMMVEQAEVRTLFSEPLHPYTLGLMGSAPTGASLQQPRTARLAAIPGTVPSPGHFPSGCPFRPRCARSFARCSTPPPVFDLGGHQVRCWLVESWMGGLPPPTPPAWGA